MTDMQTVGKTAEEVFRELMLYGNSYIPLPKEGVSMASAVSIQVEIDAALVARIQELEASNFELAKRLLESSERHIALEAQLERENDLWVVLPGKQEMVQLRGYRQKAQLQATPEHKQAQQAGE